MELFQTIYKSIVGGQHSVAVKRPPREHQDVGSSPAAIMNEKTDIGKMPPSEGGPMVQQDLSGRLGMSSRTRPVEKPEKKKSGMGKICNSAEFPISCPIMVSSRPRPGILTI